MAELGQTNADLKKTLANPAFQKIPTTPPRRSRRCGRCRRSQPAASIAHLSQTLGRLDRILGAANRHRRSPSRISARSRQPARPLEDAKALSGAGDLRSAAATAGARQMKPWSLSLPVDGHAPAERERDDPAGRAARVVRAVDAGAGQAHVPAGGGRAAPATVRSSRRCASV